MTDFLAQKLLETKPLNSKLGFPVNKSCKLISIHFQLVVSAEGFLKPNLVNSIARFSVNQLHRIHSLPNLIINPGDKGSIDHRELL